MPSESAPTVEPRDALAEYQRATYSGCGDDCQEFMERKLDAAVAVKEAMEAKDPSLYAVPIGYVAQAEREADRYGRDTIGVNMLPVSAPIQRMVAWFREHPEG
ncbi:hypothetical protein [Streptomyces sp. NTH33]|uniref:hypothetical protein n=1 Tax=Streptomyces sp. NTH33 TaxID=1735453 RepID=UPI0011B943EF|nr:hypothetical protein [Streptomyces sp. NTH33]